MALGPQNVTFKTISHGHSDFNYNVYVINRVFSIENKYFSFGEKVFHNAAVTSHYTII